MNGGTEPKDMRRMDPVGGTGAGVDFPFDDTRD